MELIAREMVEDAHASDPSGKMHLKEMRAHMDVLARPPPWISDVKKARLNVARTAYYAKLRDHVDWLIRRVLRRS